MKKVLIIITIVLAVMAVAAVVIFLVNNNNQKNNSANTNIETFAKADEENVLKVFLGDDENKKEENIDEENKDEEEEKNEEKNEQNTSSYNGKYYIKVNYQANCVTVYVQDDDGNFTKPVKAMVCSTGSATPRSGVYKTSDKYFWGGLIGGVWGHYSTRIVGSILFHSVPYTAYGDNGSLEYWEYDKLGTTASAGCVRLAVADAKWIYDNCAWGTQVEFYADSNPGPLGKPSARKISDEDESVRSWDPTDPNPNNPWRTYKKEDAKQEEVKTEPKKEEPKAELKKEETKKTDTKKEDSKKDDTKKDDTKTDTKNVVVENKITNTVTNTITNNIANNVVNNSI